MGITAEDEQLLKEHVKFEEYQRISLRTTVCLLTLNEGYEVVGTTFALSDDYSDQDTENYLAFKSAVKQLKRYIEFSTGG